ncbi:exodeoxyribonuclease VII small subunit [Candidatus Curtissbacteria bacterium]|nr:exodeoxyribonuclease VII small subunit [Candidatus Curtissbacteria bacterium]
MAKDNSFSKYMTRLEVIVARLETAELDLEETTVLLAEGMELHKKCLTKLEAAKSKIDKVIKTK